MILRRTVVISKQAEVQQLAQRVSREIFVADDLPEALDIAGTIGPDLIIFDHYYRPDCIREFIDEADRNSISVPVVAVGDGNGGDESGLCAAFRQMGAYDYLQTAMDYNRLEQIANRIRNRPQTIESEKGAGDFFAEDYAAAVSIVGRSRAIIDTLRMIKLVAASRCNPVLIIGETGTGKELAAKAVHNIRCPGERFVAVNCAALTANLLESELFGHVKGSFTGADCEKTGLLELAGGGTLFLDEISEMPLELQAKLLRVVQEKTFRKVGGVKDITCDATIIASSNRNLYEESQAGRFRSDLYYRLDICPIIIAPLRDSERRGDIQLLAEYFLKTSIICPEKSGRVTSLTKLAVEALQRYHWPGNVRELRNVIERAILLETTDKIGLSSIVIDSSGSARAAGNTPSRQIKDFSLAKAERELIARALQETGWQKTHAASMLGITRATLYAKLKQYNIEKESHTAKKTQSEPVFSTAQPAASL